MVPITGLAENWDTYQILGPFSIQSRIYSMCPPSGTAQAYFTLPYGGYIT